MNKSRSDEQQSAEEYILNELNDRENLQMISHKLKLRSGNSVQLDGYDQDKRVVCEIYARIGKLKGSQPDKIASDFLKMLLVDKELNVQHRKIFCFASQEASLYLSGKAWLGLAARQFEIETVVIELPDSIREGVLTAQRRQKMVNAENDRV